jgi:acetoacetate decarboxylase
LWDYPIVKLVADSRGRLTAADLFRPNTAFDASPQPDGSIRVVELVEKKVPAARAVKVNGRWVGNPFTKIDRRAIIEAIRERPRKSAQEVLAEARKLHKQFSEPIPMKDILKWTEEEH